MHFEVFGYGMKHFLTRLKDRKQKVTVDGITTKFLKINRGVPQGTVLCPILFSIMVNDIKSTNPINELCKFADDITVEVPGYDDDGR